MLQAYECYIENGHVYPVGLPTGVKERRRAVITILDEPKNKLPRIGFMKGLISVPDDFNVMSGDEIIEMFEGEYENPA